MYYYILVNEMCVRKVAKNISTNEIKIRNREVSIQYLRQANFHPWERPCLAKINFPLHKAEHTCKQNRRDYGSASGKKRKADEPSRARLIFGLALLPAGPEEKPLENFSAWQARPEYSSSSNERWRTYPIRFLISVIAVLNNCIPLYHPLAKPFVQCISP